MPVRKPNAGEQQDDYISRCHSALADEYTDIDQRNAICFNTWRDAKGETDTEKHARMTFPTERFVKEPAVCVFAEHETEDSKGEPQKYDREALQAIISKCNERILDTGDYATITDGHTPEKEDLAKGAKMPQVLGFMGNFRLGMVGNKKPRYAIFGDEYHFRDSHNQLKKLPRRSVELWMDPEMSERFFDPIAALGAETPRLDLGMRFAKLPTGQTVEKYTAVAPASGNTFVQTFDGDEDKKQKPEPEKYNMLAPEDLQQIIEAINELDFVQWAKSQMAKESAASTEETLGAAPGENETYQAEDETPPAEEEETVEAMEPEEEAEEYMGGKKGHYQADEENISGVEDVPMSEETNDAEVVKMSRKSLNEERSRYRKLEADHQQLQKEHYALRTQVDGIVKNASDVRREAAIDQACMEFAIDADHEKERCLYSKGATMTEAQFDEHMETITKYAARQPIDQTIPQGQIPRDMLEAERYEATKTAEATKYAEQQRRLGKRVDFQTAYEHVTADANGK